MEPALGAGAANVRLTSFAGGEMADSPIGPVQERAYHWKWRSAQRHLTMIDNALLARILFVITVAVLSIYLLRRSSRIQARQKMARCLRAVFGVTPTETIQTARVRPKSRRNGRFVRPARRSANSDRGVDFGAKANLCRVTLSRIPSLFGRLAYFASLRDPATEEYRHWGMSELYGREEANEAFSQSHAEAFSEWLSLDAAQREADFGLYRSGLEAEGLDVLEIILRLEPYRNLLPVSARQAECGAFQGALVALLETLRHEPVPPSHAYAQPA